MVMVAMQMIVQYLSHGTTMMLDSVKDSSPLPAYAVTYNECKEIIAQHRSDSVVRTYEDSLIAMAFHEFLQEMSEDL